MSTRVWCWSPYCSYYRFQFTPLILSTCHRSLDPNSDACFSVAMDTVFRLMGHRYEQRQRASHKIREMLMFFLGGFGEGIGRVTLFRRKPLPVGTRAFLFFHNMFFMQGASLTMQILVLSSLCLPSVSKRQITGGPQSMCPYMTLGF